MAINSNNNNTDTNILNSKNNSGGIKPQTTNINNISHGTVTIAKQNPDNSNLDFNVVRDSAPSVPTTLATPQTGGEKVYKNIYCNTIQTLVQSNYSSTVSGNASYLLQPPVKRKTKPMGKRNLFIVGDSRIKRVERSLIVHHLSDKSMSLKCKNFDGADVRRIQYHLLPSLHEDQIDSIIIHGTISISNISHGTVTIAKQNPDNSNLDFNVVRHSAPSVPTTLATPQTGGEKVYKNI